MFLFTPESSFNPGLESPLISMIIARFPFLGKIKTVFWICMGICVVLMMNQLH